jgi:hypothetical protein
MTSRLRDNDRFDALGPYYFTEAYSTVRPSWATTPNVQMMFWPIRFRIEAPFKNWGRVSVSTGIRHLGIFGRLYGAAVSISSEILGTGQYVVAYVTFTRSREFCLNSRGRASILVFSRIETNFQNWGRIIESLCKYTSILNSIGRRRRNLNSRKCASILNLIGQTRCYKILESNRPADYETMSSQSARNCLNSRFQFWTFQA